MELLHNVRGCFVRLGVYYTDLHWLFLFWWHGESARILPEGRYAGKKAGRVLLSWVLYYSCTGSVEGSGMFECGGISGVSEV